MFHTRAESAQTWRKAPTLLTPTSFPKTVPPPRRHSRRHLSDYGRVVEAYALLIIASLTIRVLPFRHFAWWLGRVGPEAATSTEVLDSPLPETTHTAPPPLARAVALAVQRAARRCWWTPTCLAQAMAGRALLARRGIPSTVTFGVRPGKGGAPLAAHAWLVVAHVPLLGGESAHTFHPIAHFKTPPHRMARRAAHKVTRRDPP